MIDKSWMLNPRAIRHAKICIQIIRERLNLKLKLSQADFFQQLEQCSQRIHCFELTAAHHQLMSMAEMNNDSKVTPINKKARPSMAKAVDSIETVMLAGKHYPKWQAGKALQGLYRGQPNYQ